MKQSTKEWWGLSKPSDYVKRFFDFSNMRSAVFMSAICVVLEVWMLLSLTKSYFDGLAAGKERNIGWFFYHGWWYMVLLAVAVIVLVYSLRYVMGKVKNRGAANVLLWVFCLAGLAFGTHYGFNSYDHGEQALAFVTMTLFVFGMIAWKPLWAFALTVASFGGFYYYLTTSTNVEMTYGTQVNLFTLWISTFVVCLALYHGRISEAKKDEGLEEANARLFYVATHDELTGIANMHAFHSAASVALAKAKDEGRQVALLYLDIENFKAYNQKYGFAAGDDLLRDVAHGLDSVFSDDLVARFSDDRFVAMCAPDQVEDLVEASAAVVHKLRGEIRLHARVGVFYSDGTNLSIDHALDCARIASSSIKKHPGQHLRVYDETLDNQFELMTYVVNNVGKAAREGWIKVYYQPVVDCKGGTQKLVGKEALARWDDPTYGMLPPYKFIDTLEEYREIDKIDRCIIEQVCRDIRADLNEGREVVPVSLNFSRLDFELYDVPEFLAEMALRYDVPSDLLDVEITESALTEQLEELQLNMRKLRGLNFSLWLDDFGSGYSSLNVLKDFAFNVLKIDMVFLRGFEGNENSKTILKAVVDLAHSLGMITLCEGVETKEQYDFLHEIGCDKAQGYLFGKPAPRAA